MGFKCGIVGLPNVGKSTLFNALTRAGAEARNFPFCTIEPNTGRVPVPDLRLNQLANIVKPQRMIPATIEFVDIAGLVKGASKGEGLGNQFLAHIRETDAIVHLVRCFDDENIIHVSGKSDPIEDITTINLELILCDLNSAEKALTRLQRSKPKEGTEILIALLDQKVLPQLSEGRSLRHIVLNNEDRLLLNDFQFLTMKPVLYVANVDEDHLANNEKLKAVDSLAKEEQTTVVPICATFESELAELEDLDLIQTFLHSADLHEPGLNRFIRAGYELLLLQTYFTAGVKELRAWTIPVGTTAAQAAGKIHTDFEKGFIRAEVIGFDDYINYQGESGSKEAGKWRLEGKEYRVKDGDVMHFRFNV